MDRLSLAMTRAEQALQPLGEVLQIKNPSEIERDATIQRFEFTFKAVWKLARHFLRVVEGIDVSSPKGAIRSCREVGLLGQDETSDMLGMAGRAVADPAGPRLGSLWRQSIHFDVLFNSGAVGQWYGSRREPIVIENLTISISMAALVIQMIPKVVLLPDNR